MEIVFKKYDMFVDIIILIIREYGSTLYVGMVRKIMAAHTFQLQVMS